jgi:hypothetical protein
MRIPVRGFVLVAVVLVSAAWADDKKAPPPPAPDPALTTAFKQDVGTWNCTGKMKMGDTEFATQAQMKISSELGGFMYEGEYSLPKSKALPAGMKAQIHWAYDPTSKKLLEFGVDSFGGVFRGTADGFKGDTIVWNEEGTMEGKAVKTRTTVTRKGTKEMTVTAEIEKDGAWASMGEDHCKKK